MRLTGWLGVVPLVIAACGGSTGGGGGSGGGGGAAPGLQATFGPIDLPAGVETTQCIVAALGNTTDVVMTGYDVNLLPGSHHMIVYATTDAVQPDPINCTPFAGLAVGTDTPIAFANKLQETWSFPSGVAVPIPANQNIRVEAHYINTTQGDLTGQGTITLHTTDAATAPPYQAAGYNFYGTFNISIPPNSTYSTGMLFEPGIAGTTQIQITTHQHHLGTGIQVWESTGSGQTGTQIANDMDWSNPAWSTLDPQYAFDGTNGLAFQCSWTNTTDQTVGFGESALDEMCFVGGYYYPSHGMHFCVDGQCRIRNP